MKGFWKDSFVACIYLNWCTFQNETFETKFEASNASEENLAASQMMKVECKKYLSPAFMAKIEVLKGRPTFKRFFFSKKKKEKKSILMILSYRIIRLLSDISIFRHFNLIQCKYHFKEYPLECVLFRCISWNQLFRDTFISNNIAFTNFIFVFVKNCESTVFDI